MINKYLSERLSGIHQQLMGAYNASNPMASATKGAEREFFIDLFLSQVLPVEFRFGSGDITDTHENKSGQLDVVIEYPFLPSLPIVGGSSYRLYLAESVAAVLEIKSNIMSQWKEALATGNKLSSIRRDLSETSSFNFYGTLIEKSGSTYHVNGERPKQKLVFDGPNLLVSGKSFTKIPYFIIGYKGWSNIETLEKKVQESEVDGILILDDLKFVSSPLFGSMSLSGVDSLWGFVCCLHEATKRIASINKSPSSYLGTTSIPALEQSVESEMLPAQSGTRVRNSICDECDSGKRYKECCGKL